MVFGNLGKMAEMMKQAKQIKDEMSRARYSGEAGGVKVVVNGEMEIVDLFIPPELNPAKAGPTIKDAVNRALHTAKAEAAKSLQKMTGGLNFPAP